MADDATQKYLIDELVNEVVTEDMIEDCIEFQWRCRTGNIALDEIYSTVPLDELIPDNAARAMSKANSSSGATVCCPICKEEVSGVRFAPHLEKCMNGGKRGGKKFSKAIDDYTYSLPMKTYKPRNIPEVIDPHPESLIIKVKLRNGVPHGNRGRIGVTQEEFEGTLDNS